MARQERMTMNDQFGRTSVPAGLAVDLGTLWPTGNLASRVPKQIGKNREVRHGIKGFARLC